MNRRLCNIITVVLAGWAIIVSGYSACGGSQYTARQNVRGQDFIKNSDSSGLSYWEMKNETNHRTIVVTSDKEIVLIEPGETKKVAREKNFRFTVGYPEKYGNRQSVQTFTIDDHALGIYSRYFGKQSKLQFLIGISKPTKK